MIHEPFPHRLNALAPRISNSSNSSSTL